MIVVVRAFVVCECLLSREDCRWGVRLSYADIAVAACCRLLFLAIVGESVESTGGVRSSMPVLGRTCLTWGEVEVSAFDELPHRTVSAVDLSAACRQPSVGI